jgi:hypothetical protein
MTLGIGPPEVEQKAAHAEALLWQRLGGRESFDETDVRLLRGREDAAMQAEAAARLIVSVKDRDATKVGRRFSNAFIDLLVGGYAGAYATTPPSSESAFGVYWPALIPATAVAPTLHLGEGIQVIPLPAGDREAAASPPTTPREPTPSPSTGRLVPTMLGAIVGARSGDKGGNANVGVWVRTGAEYAWLSSYLTVEQFQQLVPESADLIVHRYEFPHVRAVNFVVVGILGDGVASSTRPDAQAKGLGEFLRSRTALIPAELVR